MKFIHNSKFTYKSRGSMYVFTYASHFIFTVQARYSYEQAVCLSVRPSVKRVNCDKTKETSAHILVSHETSVHLV